MKTQEVYGVGDITGIKFGLYPAKDIDPEKSKMMIEAGFRNEFEAKMNERLMQFDMQIVQWRYTSPREYNYSNDELDLALFFHDTSFGKYNKFILENEETINAKLKENKSYDGYMALTMDCVDDEIAEQMREGFSPDPIILGYLLTSVIDFSDFDIMDYAVWDENDCPNGGDSCNDCDGCAESVDYHCVDGECVRRDEE